GQHIVHIEPFTPVSMDHLVRSTRTPAASLIEVRIVFRTLPGLNDWIDPGPGGGHFSTMDKQTWIVSSSIKHQTLVGIAVEILIGVRKVEVQNNGTKLGFMLLQVFGGHDNFDALFRLQANNQTVRHCTASRFWIYPMCHIFVLNDDLGKTLFHALTGTEIERNVCPPGIIDVRTNSDESFNGAGAAKFFLIAGHCFTVDLTRCILSAHRIEAHSIASQGPQAFKNFQFFGTDTLCSHLVG